MGKLIDGKKIARQLTENIGRQVDELRSKGVIPKLAVVLVGDDAPSKTYVFKKQELARTVGIEFDLHKFESNISQNELMTRMNEIQTDRKLDGLIVQLPIPQPLSPAVILNTVKPELDVDCLTDVSIGRLVMKTNHMLPPTAGAVMHILRILKISLRGKNVTIVGAGVLVGKPLSIIMMNKCATLTVCNKETQDIKEKCLRSDVIISGVGRHNIIRGDMIKPGAVVIDAGVCFCQKKMCGDVNVNEVLPTASWVTPTPGGVGPVTVAMLIQNTIINAQRRAGQ